MYIKVKVVPGAKIEKIEEIKEDEYRMWVKVPAENNAANFRVLEILRHKYKSKNIRIISGHHSPSKIISIN